MKVPPATVWVAVLVVLAGCPSTVGDRPATETVTPAPVPTPEVQYPPGISESRVSGPGLAGAHRRALEETNYTVVIRQRIVRIDDNQTVQRLEATRRVRAGGDSYLGRYVRSVSRFPIRRPANTIDYWTDGEAFAARQSRSGRYTYLEADGDDVVADIDDSGFINRTASALRFTITERADGSVTLAIAGLRDSEAMPTPVFVYDPRNVSGTLQVRPDGVVTAIRIAYDAKLGDQRIRVVRESRIGEVGSTTVERPDWIDEARNQTGSGNSLSDGDATGGTRTSPPDSDRNTTSRDAG